MHQTYQVVWQWLITKVVLAPRMLYCLQAWNTDKMESLAMAVFNCISRPSAALHYENVV